MTLTSQGKLPQAPIISRWAGAALQDSYLGDGAAGIAAAADEAGGGAQAAPGDERGNAEGSAACHGHEEGPEAEGQPDIDVVGQQTGCSR